MTADEVLALVDGLRARGVTAFEGLGLKLTVELAPAAGARGVPPGQPHTQTTMVDAGGGLMVDSDLFSHEAGE